MPQQELAGAHTAEAIATPVEASHDPKHWITEAAVLLDRGWGD
jgi:hypothetical protein